LTPEALAGLNPEHRARIEAETEVFRSIVDRARSPLAQQWGAALAETFLADSADFLRGLQASADKEQE
jgi:hypothetical protein